MEPLSLSIYLSLASFLCTFIALGFALSLLRQHEPLRLAWGALVMMLCLSLYRQLDELLWLLHTNIYDLSGLGLACVQTVLLCFALFVIRQFTRRGIVAKL